MYDTQSKKRKGFFYTGSAIHKIQRVDQQQTHDYSVLEKLFSVNHFKDRILHYACNSLKSYQTLEKVNKRIQSLTSYDYVNSVKICIETDNIYGKQMSASFVHQYRNVKLTFDDSEHTMKFLEEQSSNISHLKIVYWESRPLTVTFTDKKWPQLNSISLSGQSHCILLSNIPDTVCHLKMIHKNFDDLTGIPFERRIHLPPKLRTFKICSIEPIKIFNYPESLEQMTMFLGCKESFPEKVCFKNMRKLRLGCYWNSPILKTNFPALTHLHLSGDFNQSVDDLPPNITHLSFRGTFNQAVDKLPTNLTHLLLSDSFNQPIDHLPPKLTHLYLSDDFEQSVDNLPNNLQHLSLIGNFNRSVDFLPRSLTHLTLVCEIKSDIEKLPNLKFLWIDTESQRTIFPPTLEMLANHNTLHEDNFLLLKDSKCLRYFQTRITQTTEIHVPAGVVHFQLHSNSIVVYAIIHLPDSVKTIRFNGEHLKDGSKIYPEDWQSRASYTDIAMNMMDQSMKFEQYFD